MVQGKDWLENGAGRAGPVPPEKTGAYEAEGDFCKHVTTTAWFNDLVFARLPAVAEAAWTQKENKAWPRSARQVRLHPTL